MPIQDERFCLVPLWSAGRGDGHAKFHLNVGDPVLHLAKVARSLDIGPDYLA
jgi:hypothetical protein